MTESGVGVARGFLLALLIGALVGVEREKSQSASGHATFAGLRTFILLAQLGSLAAWISLHLGSPLVVVLGRGPVRTRLVLATAVLIGCAVLASLMLH